MKSELSFPHRDWTYGNSILEMLISIPIALSFLFVVCDIGLSYLDRALISDAVRESMHEYSPSQYNSNVSPMFRVTRDGPEINLESIALHSERIASRFQEVMSERRVSFLQESSLQRVKIIVTPIELSINTDSGEVLGINKLPSVIAGNTALSLGDNVKKVSEDVFLTERLSISGAGAYALPSGQTGQRYLPLSLGVLLSVEAVSPSINPYVRDLVLGSSMGIQIHEFQLVRN